MQQRVLRPQDAKFNKTKLIDFVAPRNSVKLSLDWTNDFLKQIKITADELNNEQRTKCIPNNSPRVIHQRKMSAHIRSNLMEKYNKAAERRNEISFKRKD